MRKLTKQERLERKIDDREAFQMRLDAIRKGRTPWCWVEKYLRGVDQWWRKPAHRHTNKISH